MTTKTDIDVKMMTDADLAALVAAGQAEIALRERQRKEETIAQIRLLASKAGLAVQIAGARGRPGGSKPAVAKPADAPKKAAEA